MDNTEQAQQLSGSHTHTHSAASSTNVNTSARNHAAQVIPYQPAAVEVQRIHCSGAELAPFLSEHSNVVGRN